MLVLFACAEQEDPVGDLQVAYRVGSGSSTCADVGIQNVRIYLMSSRTESVFDETVACDPDDQSVILDDVPAGDYYIRVEGLDAEAQPIYTGETDDKIEVAADQTNGPETVILDQLRPSVLIWVGFEDVGGCDRFEVTDVRVVIYENGAAQFYDEEFDCVDLTTGDGLLVEDMSATATYDIRVRGANENDEYTYEYNVDAVEVQPGSPTEVSAELTSCSGVCTDP